LIRLFGGGLTPLVVGLVLATIGAAVADPLQEGSLAYQRKDYEAALNIWRPIAEHGSSEAQRWLGRLYDNGLGVPKDQAKAAFWYRNAAEQGDTYAQSRLGQMYIMGGDTITRDTGIGLMWLKKAADQGDASVQNFLGNLYSDGMWGVRRDEDQAAAWYRKAADQGDRHAMLSLSTAALSRKDYPEFLIWTRKLADLGDHSAELTLGSMYIEGQGVPKDREQGLAWLKKAASENDFIGSLAKTTIERLESEGTAPAPPDFDKAPKVK
jgi:TPR repeat protein